MKNVKVLQSRPIFRVLMEGLPPLSGWQVRYVSGIDPKENIKPGFWMSQWNATGGTVTFVFEPELVMCFTDETETRKISDFLQKEAEIETEVVKIGQ